MAGVSPAIFFAQRAILWRHCVLFSERRLRIACAARSMRHR